MARMSYISSVERYHEYEQVIHSLLDSILMSIEDGLNKNRDTRFLVKQYPFLELQYCLNESGLQQGIYNIVLVLPYINMNPPQVYMCSPS